MKALGVIHAERQHQPVTIAVVFGAAHIPAAVDCRTGIGYHVENAQWLMVAHAPAEAPGRTGGISRAPAAGGDDLSCRLRPAAPSATVPRG